MFSLFPRRCAACGVPTDSWMCSECLPEGVHILRDPSDHLQALVYMSTYDTPLGTLIRRSKIEGHRNTFVHLGKILAHKTKSTHILRDVHGVVAVPSPWTRRLRRGFSPSAAFTHGYAQRRNDKIYRPLHLRPGPRQATLSKQARKTNIVHRLSGSGTVPPTLVLMDDIYTTGTTLDQCAQHLKALGALKVIGLVACVSS